MQEPNVDKYEIAAKLLEEGKDKESFENYLMLAKTGEIHAQLMVGWFYQLGQGTVQDIDKAIYWYSKAATAESPEGQFYLGSLYRLEGKNPEAIMWIKKSALYKYVPALYRLGKMYDIGEGAAVDKEKANEYLEEAARKGHLFAKREISIKMMKGERGIMSIFKGLLIFLSLIINGILIGWKEPNSDLIRK